MFGNLSRIIDPNVQQYLLTAEDEQIVDEVRRHPAAVLFPVFRLLVAAALSYGALFVDPRIGLLLTTVTGTPWRKATL